MSDNDKSAHIQTEPDASSPFVREVRSNIQSDLIWITEDKLENILLKHKDKLQSRSFWTAPFSLFISALLAHLTATFDDAFNLKAATWEAIFLLVTGGAGLWLFITLIRMLIYWSDCEIPSLLRQIKDAEQD